jgi:DNA-binding NarL/FixJ family response regulator
MTMHVLLVEDSKLLRDAITEMLEGCEHVSIDAYATNKTDAIALLDEKKFDLIIADIELAEGNGFDVIKHTQKADYPFPTPITVMLTNHGNAYYKNMAKQIGVQYFYDKSMDFELAIETIEQEAKRFTLNS